MPIAYLIFSLIVGSIELAIRWAQGAAVPAFDRSLLQYVLLVPVLPFFTTLPLLLRGNRRPWQVLQVFAWALAVIPALLFGMQGPLSWGGTLWGGWLYLGVSAGALILEVALLVAGRDPRARASS